MMYVWIILNSDAYSQFYEKIESQKRTKKYKFYTKEKKYNDESDDVRA